MSVSYSSHHRLYVEDNDMAAGHCAEGTQHMMRKVL